MKQVAYFVSYHCPTDNPTIDRASKTFDTLSEAQYFIVEMVSRLTDSDIDLSGWEFTIKVIDATYKPFFNE